VSGFKDWPHVDQLFKAAELVIGLRNQDAREDIHAIVEDWKVKPQAVTIFPSFAPEVSSGKVREALRKREPVSGLLKSVERYSDHNWLYVSLA
jgi:nicotinic acid mononucleotide adenylyltransferase